VCCNAFIVLRIIHGTFCKEIVQTIGKYFLLEPTHRAILLRADKVDGGHAYFIQTIIYTIFDKIDEIFLIENIHVTFFKDPFYNFFLNFDRLFYHVGNARQRFVVQYFRIFFFYFINKINTRISMNLFTHRSRCNNVAYILNPAFESGKGKYNSKLAEQGYVVYQNGKQIQSEGVLLLIVRFGVSQHVRQIVDTTFDTRNLNEFFKFIVIPQHFQQTRIRLTMTKLTLGKGATQSIQFRFGKMIVQIAPECFYGYFYLGDSQQSPFYRIALRIGKVTVEILRIGSKIHLGMYPERLINCLGKLQYFRVFKRLVINT